MRRTTTTRQVQDLEPYVLAFNNNEICIRGSRRFLDDILKVYGSQERHASNFSFVTLPYIRENFLVAEANASPAAVSDGYRSARRHLLSPTLTQIGWIRQQLELSGLDPGNFLDQQTAAMFYSAGRDYMFNASEQGTGKTRTCLGLSQLWGCRKLLVVCPKSLVGEWRDESVRINSAFAFEDLGDTVSSKNASLRRLSTSKYKVMSAVNYDTVDDLKEAIGFFRPDCILADESYRIKNPKAGCSKALHGLSVNCRKRICATGTPIGNDVGDLYSQCKFLDPNLRFGTHTDFCNRFVKYTPRWIDGRAMQKPSGCQDIGGLISLLSPFWFRVTKEECLDLPPKVKREITLEMPTELRSLYRDVINRGEAALGSVASLADARVIHLRLQQICGSIAPDLSNGLLANEQQVDAEANRPRVHREMPCAKLEWLKTFCRDNLEGNPGRRTIVWVRYIPELERIERELGQILGQDKVRSICGRTRNSDIDAIKASFNSRSYDGVQLIVAQIDKMHSGHNLQAADDNIFFSHTWSYIKLSQAEDRSHRQGRQGSVSYTSLIYRNSIDENIMEAMANKTDLAISLSLSTLKR